MPTNPDDIYVRLAGDGMARTTPGSAAFWSLLSGATSARITGRGARVVPRGMWHTAEVFAPSCMFFVTRGDATQHRPADKA